MVFFSETYTTKEQRFYVRYTIFLKPFVLIKTAIKERQFFQQILDKKIILTETHLHSLLTLVRSDSVRVQIG